MTPFDDAATNFVILSAKLLQRYPEVARDITEALDTAGVRWKTIKTANIWTRDFLPLQVGEKFVSFAYRGYGGFRQFPWLRVPAKTWNFLDSTNSRIVLDGGNCQRGAGVAILTEMIFRHNPSIPRTRLIARLEKLLECEIVTVPVEPQDDIGHTDGTLKFIPGRREVLLNDYRRMGTKAYCRYAERVERALDKAGIAFHLFPYAYHRTPRLTEGQFRRDFPDADTFNPGLGYYINFLLVGNMVILPTFGIEEDAEAIDAVKRHLPTFAVRTADCSRLAMEGGLVNCVTMNYRMAPKGAQESFRTTFIACAGCPHVLHRGLGQQRYALTPCQRDRKCHQLAVARRIAQRPHLKGRETGRSERQEPPKKRRAPTSTKERRAREVKPAGRRIEPLRFTSGICVDRPKSIAG